MRNPAPTHRGEKLRWWKSITRKKFALTTNSKKCTSYQP
ncbi:MAG: hypothetical protein ACJAXX_002605 [Roseivirga sp.]